MEILRRLYYKGKHEGNYHLVKSEGVYCWEFLSWDKDCNFQKWEMSEKRKGDIKYYTGTPCNMLGVPGYFLFEEGDI